MGLPLGYSSDTMSQAMESQWDALKDAMPSQTAHWSVPAATQKGEQALGATFQKRCWVSAGPAGGWVVNTELEGQPWMHPRQVGSECISWSSTTIVFLSAFVGPL